LVAWGVSALAGAESIPWDLSDNDAPEGMIVQELALPALSSHPAPPERVEKIAHELLSCSHFLTFKFSTSSGFPVKTGRDLLTYLEINRT